MPITFVYQKALIRTFHTSFLTTPSRIQTLEHKLKSWFCTQKPVLTFVLKVSSMYVYNNRSGSDLVWQIQLISIKV